MKFPIVCFNCGARGKVASVTPGLQCRCGSTDIDLDDQQVTAGRHDVHPNFQEGFDDTLEPWTRNPHVRGPEYHESPRAFDPSYQAGEHAGNEYVRQNTDPHEEGLPLGPSGKHREGKAHGPGTGWNQPKPDPLRGWNEYAGPHANPNPLIGDDLVSMPHGNKCPICKGSGYDISDRSVCRECGGSGVYTPVSTPASKPQVARHPGQTKTPFFGSKKKTVDYNSDIFVMTASCPNDGEAMTHLARDKNGHAWWSCKCGSLANLDVHPEIDPYNPPKGFSADRSFKARKLLTASKADAGKLFQILAAVQNTNEVTPREALNLTREALKRHPER